jgi:hypothetical protein
VNLISHFHLVLRLRMVELYLLFPIRLHDVMLNYLKRGDNFSFHLGKM